MNELSKITMEKDVAVLTIDSPPVNALGLGVRRALEAGIRLLAKDDSVSAIIILCVGRTFFAGADISEFGKPQQSPLLPEVLEHIENCPKPVIAAIHGTALGGGYELALNCHYRIAVPSAKVGLPEVKLGLLPGAGGTQRLPRLVGPALALDLIVKGDSVPAPRALELGMIDALAREGQLHADAVAYARKILVERLPLRRVRDRDDRVARGAFEPDLFEKFRAAHAGAMRGFKAPEHIVRAIEASVSLPFDQAIMRERELFQELRGSPESAAQRYYFFAERETAKVPAMHSRLVTRPVACVGVVGAGAAGCAIAMAVTKARLPVVLVDADRAALDRVREAIRASYEVDVRTGEMGSGEIAWRGDYIVAASELSALSDADLVIEAVAEKMDTKKQIFSQLEGITKPDAILATSTSLLDVDEIASASQRPERMVGLHFLSPVNVSPLLEVVRGAHTAPDVVATAMQFASKIGKLPVLSGAREGLIADRIMWVRSAQAEAAILQGASPAEVDQLLRDYGFPIGHSQMKSLVGTGGPGWGGMLGTPSGGTVRTDGIVVEAGNNLLERMLFPMVNEGARLLEEGIALRASDIDVAAVLGYGWPVYRGGPMFWADNIGLPRVLNALRTFQTRYGDTFKPACLLEEKVARGASFTREQ